LEKAWDSLQEKQGSLIEHPRNSSCATGCFTWTRKSF